MTPTGEPFGFPIPLTMAFQPIVNVASNTPFAYEALVRGRSGEGAAAVLSAVTPSNRSDFDRQCRSRAMEVAAGLDFASSSVALSINMAPLAADDPGVVVDQTVESAARWAVPHDRLIFELTEHERVDIVQLGQIIALHRRCGFRTAIDDFGAGHSGLSLLADFQPDIVKLDMALVRGIHRSRARRVIVGAVVGMCADLGIDLVAEGIETAEEQAALQDLGVRLMQGYFFAKPAIEAFPEARGVIRPGLHPAYTA